MAEVLIRVVDKGATDLHSKAGDVIAVCPDGWKWSAAELSNTDWVIVKAPNITVDALNDMLTPDRNGTGKLLRCRGRAIDMSAPIIANTLANLPPDNRVVLLDTGAKRTAFLAARFTKPAVTETVVLG